MDKAILDTDIYSEILRAKNPKLVATAVAYRQQFGVYSLTAASVVEIVTGLQQLGATVRLQGVLTAISSEEVLPLDRESAIIAGKIHGELMRTGRTIGRIDPMIAGVALHRDLTLVTGNTQHYQRVIQLGFPLRLENWRV
jgi:tRNA(fMet)-specific endonuclease VapC